MILQSYIGEKVSCHECGMTDWQDYFTLRDFGHNDIGFICDPCKGDTAPLPETFSQRFEQNFRPEPADVIGLVFAALPIITLCVIAILAGGGK